MQHRIYFNRISISLFPSHLSLSIFLFGSLSISLSLSLSLTHTYTCKQYLWLSVERVCHSLFFSPQIPINTLVMVLLTLHCSCLFMDLCLPLDSEFCKGKDSILSSAPSSGLSRKLIIYQFLPYGQGLWETH